LNKIADYYPDLTLTITDDVRKEFINIIICYFVTYSLKIAQIYNNDNSHGKTSRIQYKQLVEAFILNITSTKEYTTSQKEFLHYVLMSKKTINNWINKKSVGKNNDDGDDD
jgi:hypothetical protein